MGRVKKTTVAYKAEYNFGLLQLEGPQGDKK